jgi:hypothetical protein
MRENMNWLINDKGQIHYIEYISSIAIGHLLDYIE